MKLQLISDQGGGSLGDYYAALDPRDFNPSWAKPIERIKKLVDHLEQNVEGPAQRVTVSHTIIFYLSDEDDWRPEKARVRVDLNRVGYKIRYRSANDSFTTLEARDVVEAGRMIREGLERAERNLPGRGES